MGTLPPRTAPLGLEPLPRHDSLTALAAELDTDKGAGPWRHGYTLVYDRLFGAQPIASVLEFGIWRGGSIRLWLRRWPAAHVHAVDWDIPTPLADRLLAEAGPARLSLWRAVADDPELLRALATQGPFDLIVDDAGHFERQQTACLAALWPHLAPGGWYVVEDVMHAALPERRTRWRQITASEPCAIVPSAFTYFSAVCYRRARLNFATA